ncbi:MAG TPA: hypothetical protein VHG52_13470, partial [Thermomicrobiales bacterium]|nr:hypothetical protein [Thermomicrobiales bacterium]
MSTAGKEHDVRRLIILGIVAQLGLAPLGVRSASAQEWENNAWQGVTVGEPVSSIAEGSAEPFQLLADFLGEPKEGEAVGPDSVGARLDEAYPVAFKNDPNSEHYAFIPEVQGAEFMVVIVNSGEFVVDVKGPGSFLIDPVVGPELTSKDIDKVRIMHGVITGTEVEYFSTEQFVLDEKGNDCTSLCTVLPGVAVQVTDGDRIIAPAGAICIWCLLNHNEHTTESEGELYVFPLLDEGETFSWSQY